jgi:hypothetical protein
VSDKHAHLHRRASWARLRLRAAKVILAADEALAEDGFELGTLLLVTLGASLAGLLLALCYHLYRGLVG